MRRFLWFLLLLIVSVWVGLKIAADPGYAMFTYGHWSVSMPLWFAVVTVFLGLVLLYGLLRFFDTIDFSLYRFKNWLRWRRKYKSYSKTNRGLVELIEGRWRTAEYYLLDGVERSDAPLINYLGAAKAAQEQKAFDRRDIFLRKAHDCAPQADIAIGVTQAQLQCEQGQLEQALATLKHLRTLAPKNKLILQLLEKVYVRLSDWSALLELLPCLRKAKLITSEQLEQFEKNMYQELLRVAAHKHEGIAPIQRVWESIPKKIQHDVGMVEAYVQWVGKDSAAALEVEELINKVLKKTWSSALVRCYGILIAPDSKKRLARAETWQKHYGNHAILSLTLGRLCMQCQLWGKARSYFEESLKQEVLPEVYMEYGLLLEQLGDIQAAAKSYREGLGCKIGN